MKSGSNIYLKYTGIILILVILVVAYGYRNSQHSPGKDDKIVKTPTSTVSQAKTKKMAPGAACCKASFSRTKILSVKNAHTNITPERK
ncbi:hypothetical protein [Daejeonella sp.]|uniref:hypothetical protein n=1 Tax=Daejeonella sp. TaxID=2805397 RepID=UPI0030BB56FB